MPTAGEAELRAWICAWLQLAVPLCPSLEVYLNGSAIALYKSDSYYDDLLWAAAWMYKASGELPHPLCWCYNLSN